MKVAIFAGTFVDTDIGAKILIENGFDCVKFPLAKSPKEQNDLQFFSSEFLEERIYDLMSENSDENFDKVLIYCNSLSSAIDYKRLENRLSIEVVTPLECYKKLPKDINSVFVLCANAVSAYMIEKILIESHPSIKTMTLSNLSIVEDIEAGFEPQEILRRNGIYELFEYINKIEQRPDGILLGCTHFPYISEAIASITDLKIIDPTDYMLKSLMGL